MFLVKGLHFVDFQCIGVSVFVKVGSGDAFSTAWGCKGGIKRRCKGAYIKYVGGEAEGFYKFLKKP